MESYIKRIKEFANNLDVEILSELEKIYVSKKFIKGAHLLKPGQICSGHILIENGIARKYFSHKEKEITSEIYFDDDVAISIDSYIMQIPGNVYIEALTDLTVIIIDYRQFQEAKRKFPQLVILDKMFIEYYAVWFEKRLQEFQTMDASQRYLKLIEKNAKIIQFIPVTIVASYLNISLETLSRIRSKIVRL